MNSRNLLAATALQTGALVLMASASPAFAGTAAGQPGSVTTTSAPPSQTPPTGTALSSTQTPVTTSTTPVELATNTDTSIVVTGSRIRRPNLDSPVPITSVSAQELTSRGEVSLGDALNQLPSLRGTFSQANSTTSIGTAALSILDLRGLGTARTLVLVNGRRVVTSQPGTFTVDVNTIPVDLLERVDVVTGGNSAVYGSDAVAGVVNFILRKDFDGFKVRAQYGTSTYNDRGNKFISAVAGHNFFDGKLNITAAGEYSKSDPVFYSDRPYLGAYTGPSGFYTTEITTAKNRNFDGIPNTSFWSNQGGTIPGITFGNASTGGYVATFCPSATQSAANALVCTGQTGPTGNLINYNYAFLPDGTLAKDVPYFDNRAIGGGIFGGLSATGLENAMLLPGLERMVGNVFLNADISPAFKPFAEATFVHINATQQSTQPTFLSSSLSAIFNINNPFLSAQARNLLTQIPGVTNSQIISANTCRARTGLATGCFQMVRFNYDLGTRAENHKRETWRLVGGVRGDLLPQGNLSYEVSLNYGHTWTYYETGGNVLVANFNKASNVVAGPSGQPICFINSSADVIPAGQPNAGAVNTANDDPSCVPLNLFGQGNESQAAKDYILYKSSRVQRATELDGTAFISGDTTGFFRLPGGPVSFALGGEYREESASSVYDPVTTSGATFLNSFQPFLPPKEKIAEGFGEIRIPILKDMTFFKELTAEGAARYSHYNGSIGGVWAYNAGLTWAPVRSIMFRGGYARSVRAPTLSDLYAAQTQTFANTLVDPCDQPAVNTANTTDNITNGPNRAKNCAAAGVPTTLTYTPVGSTTPVTVAWYNRPGSGVFGFNQGNAGLKPEVGNSWNIGTVITPSFIPGLALTVDYWHIKVKNIISGLTAQQIVDRCYDDPTGLNNQFCAVVSRQTSTDPLVNAVFAGESTRQITGQPNVSFNTTGPAFLNQPYNFAARVRRGIDFDASYSHRLPGNVRMSLRGIVSLLLDSENFSFLTDPSRSDKIDTTLGDPRWRASWNADFNWKNFGVAYSGTYSSHELNINFSGATYETWFTWQGRGPTNPEARPSPWYPSQIRHNIRFNWNPWKQLRLYAGVDNLTNKLPPLDLTGIESAAPYDPTGRYYYGGVEYSFK